MTHQPLRILVHSLNSRREEFTVSGTISCDGFKDLVLAKIYGNNQAGTQKPLNRLIRVKDGIEIDGDPATSIGDKIDNNDEFVLLKRRSLPSTEQPSPDSKFLPSPTLADISKATIGLPRQKADHTARMTQETTPAAPDGQRQLRRVLLSLIDVAEKLLIYNKDAESIFKGALDVLDKEETGAQKVDQNALVRLKDMGFSENRSKRALLATNMNFEAAMNWMVEHESDPGIDDPIRPKQNVEDSESSTSSEQDQSPVVRLLERLRASRKKGFRPDPRALKTLMEMGFKENEVTDALRVNNNDQSLACEWLLGERKEQPDNEDTGIDPSSSAFRAILSDATVQLGLNNPRTFIAMLHILDNPMNANHYINDPEIGPLLVQVTKIYHAEKNAST